MTESIGQRLKTWRLEHGHTQAEIADRLAINMFRLSRIENEKTPPTPHEAAAIALLVNPPPEPEPPPPKSSDDMIVEATTEAVRAALARGCRTIVIVQPGTDTQGAVTIILRHKGVE